MGSCTTRRGKPSTGLSSERWHDWRGRRTRVWRDTSTRLSTCVGRPANCLQGRKKVWWLWLIPHTHKDGHVKAAPFLLCFIVTVGWFYNIVASSSGSESNTVLITSLIGVQPHPSWETLLTSAGGRINLILIDKLFAFQPSLLFIQPNLTNHKFASSVLTICAAYMHSLSLDSWFRQRKTPPKKSFNREKIEQQRRDPSPEIHSKIDVMWTKEINKIKVWNIRTDSCILSTL